MSIPQEGSFLANTLAPHTSFMGTKLLVHLECILKIINTLSNHRKFILKPCQFHPNRDFRDANDNPSYFYYFYFKPWIHIIPFFIGFIFGAFLLRFKSKNRSMILKKVYANLRRWSLPYHVIYGGPFL